MAKIPVKSPSRSSGAGRRSRPTRPRSQTEIEGIRKARERQLAAAARRRPRVTPAPFTTHIPSALHYYLTKVTILPTGSQTYVFLVRHKGQPPISNAAIQRQLEDWWEQVDDREDYPDKLGPWKIEAIYQA